MKSPLTLAGDWGLAFCPDYSANLTGRASGLYRGIQTNCFSPRNRISHYSYWLGRVWAGSSWRNRTVPVPTTTPPPWHFPALLRNASIIIAYLSLTACAQQPIIQVERINVPTYIPTPATLTATVKVDLTQGVTWGQAVGRLNEGLQSCNANLSAIAGLTPPAPNPPKP